MTYLIDLAAIEGCMASFIIIAWRKMGIFDWIQARTPHWLPWDCDFCLGFWFSILFTILALLFVPITVNLVVVPIIATAVNHMITK